MLELHVRESLQLQGRIFLLSPNIPHYSYVNLPCLHHTKPFPGLWATREGHGVHVPAGDVLYTLKASVHEIWWHLWEERDTCPWGVRGRLWQEDKAGKVWWENQTKTILLSSAWNGLMHILTYQQLSTLLKRWSSVKPYVFLFRQLASSYKHEDNLTNLNMFSI